MPAMTQQQAFRAMRILAELWADQMGYKNPNITVTVKNENNLQKEGEKTNAGTNYIH